jgi:L-alanine-DL-glutamate epimerase-like enolase superfamily enzyme
VTKAQEQTNIRAEGSRRDREIVAARVIVTCPGRNFVTLKLETRSGICGLGDATLNGRELAVAAYLEQHVVPNLIGRDAGRIEDTCMGAALHFDTWVPNFGIQEYMLHTDETDAVFPHDYAFRDGRLYCGETPGHGVTIDEQMAARYPYTPKQLPVARLDDGTIWDW